MPTTTFDVLAEPTRRRILDDIRDHERSVNELVQRLHLSQPGVSKHLRVLRESGLVEVRRDAQRRLYRVRPEPLEQIDAWLETRTQAYGGLLDALDQSPHKDNTLIVFWSDHGWHLGEKLHWRKFTLWEEATRAPMIWVVPGVTRAESVCDRTVDFMSVYPTLTDLCGIPTPKHVEGETFRSLLADPKAAWDRPARTTYLFNNHTIRTEKWRYIRYHDGGEELYDETKDPLEWTNLAMKPEFAAVKKDLAKWLPKTNKVTPKEAISAGGPNKPSKNPKDKEDRDDDDD